MATDKPGPEQVAALQRADERAQLKAAAAHSAFVDALESLTAHDLRQMAIRRGLRGFGHARRYELLAALVAPPT